MSLKADSHIVDELRDLKANKKDSSVIDMKVDMLHQMLVTVVIL
jgi:hypothetical protein